MSSQKTDKELIFILFISKIPLEFDIMDSSRPLHMDNLLHCHKHGYTAYNYIQCHCLVHYYAKQNLQQAPENLPSTSFLHVLGQCLQSSNDCHLHDLLRLTNILGKYQLVLLSKILRKSNCSGV